MPRLIPRILGFRSNWFSIFSVPEEKRIEKGGIRFSFFFSFFSFGIGYGGPFGWSPGSFTLNKLECSIQACKGLEYINMG